MSPTTARIVSNGRLVAMVDPPVHLSLNDVGVVVATLVFTIANSGLGLRTSRMASCPVCFRSHKRTVPRGLNCSPRAVLDLLIALGEQLIALPEQFFELQVEVPKVTIRFSNDILEV